MKALENSRKLKENSNGTKKTSKVKWERREGKVCHLPFNLFVFIFHHFVVVEKISDVNVFGHFIGPKILMSEHFCIPKHLMCVIFCGIPKSQQNNY